MLRYYCRAKQRGDTFFRTDCDRLNWAACEAVFRTLTSHEQDTLMAIYTIPASSTYDAIMDYTRRQNIQPPYIWKLVNNVAFLIGKQRGLIP